MLRRIGDGIRLRRRPHCAGRESAEECANQAAADGTTCYLPLGSTKTRAEGDHGHMPRGVSLPFAGALHDDSLAFS